MKKTSGIKIVRRKKGKTVLNPIGHLKNVLGMQQYQVDKLRTMIKKYEKLMKGVK